jgi:predicted lipid-binding transport protein (Tim44 family)
MKWNQFMGGVFVGAAFGIMVGAAYGPGSPDKVSTGTAGFCTLLVLAGAAAISKELRRPHPKGTANEPASNSAGPGLEDKTPPAR